MESQQFVRCAVGMLFLQLVAVGCSSVPSNLARQDLIRGMSPSIVSDENDSAVNRQAVRLAEILPVEFTSESGDSDVLPVLSLKALEQDSFVESYPIDLPTALRLAGANNLQIAFAAEQVREACARVEQADVLWLPSLRAGVEYNNHAGRIQATDGNVIESSRNSLFVGAGAGLGNSPLAGGAGGPIRMTVDLSLVDVFFEPLAARQVAEFAQANQAATFNDTLLTTALAYLNITRAQALIEVQKEAVTNAAKLARLTEDFASSGQGLQADVDRAKAELASRQRDVLQAQESTAVSSAQLARLLRLDPTTRLLPADLQPVQLQLVEPNQSVHKLIAQAQALRPELARATATLQETSYRSQQEHWRPLVPHLYAGMSGGGFGGAPGSSVDNFSDRTDFDIGAVWEVQNLGLGNRSRRMQRESQHRQAHFALESLKEQIAAEVTQVYEQIQYRNEQITAAEIQVRAASDALKLNLEGIRGGVIRPIEIQQAIGALARARQQYLDSITDYNRAQFTLLRSIGQTSL